MHLIEERSAEAALDAAMLIWPNIDAAWQAASWALLHDPSIGAAVTESGRTRALAFPGDREAGIPDITLLYEIAGDTIIIHDARFRDSVFSRSGSA